MAKKTFNLKNISHLTARFPFFKGNVRSSSTGTADHPHADVRRPSLPIFLLPLHSQCPPSLFFTQERHTRRFFPSHTRNSAGSCVIPLLSSETEGRFTRWLFGLFGPWPLIFCSGRVLSMRLPKPPGHLKLRLQPLLRPRLGTFPLTANTTPRVLRL